VSAEPVSGPGGWGWHRLADPWANRVVAEAAIRPGELVLDIGAGTGALTAPLVEAGARVVAVDLHPGRLAELRRRFGSRVTVVRADAARLRLPRRPFRVVASPPFAVTAPLLRRLLQPGTRLTAADLVLQRATARRWATGRAPGASRWLSEFDLRLGTPLPRRAFRPPPPVDAVVLTIRRVNAM
jgi:23S rRNA (adenine-N6)-dimethyltransferase